MKKLFFLMMLVISNQSFAAFEKDAEGDYVLTPTSELFAYIAKRHTIIDERVDNKKFKIRIVITTDDLDLLSEAFLDNQIFCVIKEKGISSEHIYKIRYYQAITTSFYPISFSLEILPIGWGHMHYR